MNISSRERLQHLGKFGPVFEGQVAMQSFGWDARRTAHYLWLWKRAGSIEPLGGKSDVFFNLAIYPDAGAHLEDAIRRAMPGAVIGFHTVLHAAGLTTQRPGKLHLLVRPRENNFAISRAEVEVRSVAFWQAIDDAHAITPGSSTHLPRLTPAAALADSAMAEDGLAPDDLDLDEVGVVATAKLRRILARLGHGPFEPEAIAAEIYTSTWLETRSASCPAPRGRRTKGDRRRLPFARVHQGGAE